MTRWLSFAGALLLFITMNGCRSAAPARKKDAAAGPPPVAAAASREQAAAREQALEQRVRALANFATGLSQEINENPDQALAHYLAAAEADPAQEELVLQVSRQLLQRQQFDKAAELLQKAANRPDASAGVLSRLGLAYAQTGKTNEAIAAYRAAIKQSPRYLPSYQGLAQLHAQARQPKEVLAVLDEAAKVKDLDAGSLVDLAELYTAYGRIKELGDAPFGPRALAVLDRALALDPQDPNLLNRLADGYRTFGSLDRAKGIFEKLLERFPREGRVREKLAEIYLRTGDRTQARAQLEAMVREHPSNAGAYYFLGAIAVEDKRFADAVELYRKALLFNPEFEQAYYDLAGVYVSSDKPADALSTLDQAAGKFRENFLVEFYRGVAHTQLKAYATAIRHFTAAEVVAKATDPERLTKIFYFQFAAACERAGDFNQAEKLFETCIQMAPDFPDALNYLGYMWAERGVKLEQAKSYIEKALELEPKSAAYLDSLGWVCFKMDRLADALKYVLESVERSEKPDATLYDHLGDVYRAMKRYGDAREAWRKSLAIEPNELIQKKLDASPTE